MKVKGACFGAILIPGWSGSWYLPSRWALT